MNDPKAPQFLTDLVQDLRDRRLLPLLAVIAVAIVAVPFALASHHSGGAAPPGGVASASATPAASTSRFVVVAANPGLRDYRKRLAGLSARDPFQQPLGGPVGASSGAGSAAAGTTTVVPTTVPTSASSGGSGSTTVSTTGSVGGSTGSTAATGPSTSVPSTPSSGGSGGNTGTTQTKYASYQVDVRIVRQGKPHVQRGVSSLTRLPNRKRPLVIFMGVSPDAKKALLLVSQGVGSVFGDAKCAVGSQSCQLLELQPGLPETFISRANGASYRISVLKITRVLRRAP